MDGAPQVLLFNFGASALFSTALWRLGVRLKDPSFIDCWWPIGIVLLAWLSFAGSPGGGAHALAILILVSIWGLRLGVYLFARWRRHGMDRRYAALIESAHRKRGWSFGTATLLLVFALQMPLQFVVSLPVQLGMFGTGASLGAIAWCGIVFAVLGIVLESIADWQLARFKASALNKGKVMRGGLWRYSRHPNHFGDACAWWGLFLIAAESGLGVWSLPGPLLLTYLLLRVSGAPTIEPHLAKTRPDYENYYATTSPFIPWPPKS